jgi:hypothetical protein
MMTRCLRKIEDKATSATTVMTSITTVDLLRRRRRSDCIIGFTNLGSRCVIVRIVGNVPTPIADSGHLSEDLLQVLSMSDLFGRVMRR